MTDDGPHRTDPAATPMEPERTRLELDRLRIRREQSRIFLDRWRTDVAPVHEKTERSREFRTQYLQIALLSLYLMNCGALIAFPVIAKLLDAAITANLRLVLQSEGSFLLGLLLVVTANLLAFITLDADVIRQKGERAAAREQLIREGFPDRHGDSPEAERVKSAKHQARYWKLGVGLIWTALALLALAALAFLTGCILAGQVLATASV